MITIAAISIPSVSGWDISFKIQTVDKATIRSRMKKKRANLSEKRRQALSHAICERLLMRCRGKKLVCAYEALPTEVDTAEFFERFEGEIVVPEKRGDEYVVDRASEVEVWLCPGLAFTWEGDRCGFGGGWYDRFLSVARPDALKLGVGYHFQVVTQLPREKHDILLDEIITDGVSLDYEKALNCETVIGVDEAGRGPLVGGVYAAAVTATLDLAESLLRGEWSLINDSKQLSPEKRDRLAAIIKSTPGCHWAIASANAKEIDELNILRATHLAMNRAVSSLALPDAVVLVDGLPVKSLPASHNLVKGDAKSLFIAAASILAKTARDEDCLRLERLYPGYGFAVHKGYPTAAHYAALKRLGPCAEHRRSFDLKLNSPL